MLSPYWPFLYKLSIALHSYDFMLREIRVGHGSGRPEGRVGSGRDMSFQVILSRDTMLTK